MGTFWKNLGFYYVDFVYAMLGFHRFMLELQWQFEVMLAEIINFSKFMGSAYRS